MEIAELLAKANIIRNETGADKNTAKRIGEMLLEILQKIDENDDGAEKIFLRKDREDVAEEHISFEKGLDALGFEAGKTLGRGAGIYNDEQENAVVEADKLLIRKSAWFNELIVNQIRFQGGIVVYSAATLEVVSVYDGGSYIEARFDTKGGLVPNLFMTDDQVRCKRYYAGDVLKYYMSRVTSVGVDYIRLSKWDIDGTLTVEVGDTIVQFGNRTNIDRQSVIEVNVLEGGKQTFYQHVNSYTLTDKNYLELGRVEVNGAWRNMIRSYGGAYIGNRDLSSYLKHDSETGELEIRAKVQYKSPSGTYKDTSEAIEEVAANVTYKVEIYSSYGNIFHNGIIATTLIARVFKGKEDVTSTIPLSAFKWERKSENAEADDAWNGQHATFYSNILSIDGDDVDAKATFNCIVNI